MKAIATPHFEPHHNGLRAQTTRAALRAMTGIILLSALTVSAQPQSFDSRDMWRPNVARGLGREGGNTLLMGPYHVEIFPKANHQVTASVIGPKSLTPNAFSHSSSLVVLMVDAIHELQEARLHWNALTKRFEGRFRGHHPMISGPMSVELNVGEGTYRGSVGAAAVLPPALYSGQMVGVGRYAFEVVMSSEGILRLIPRTVILPHVLRDFEVTVTPSEEPEAEVSLVWMDGKRRSDGVFMTLPQSSVSTHQGLMIKVRQGAQVYRNAIVKVPTVSENRIAYQLNGRIDLPPTVFSVRMAHEKGRRGPRNEVAIQEIFDEKTQNRYLELRGESSKPSLSSASASPLPSWSGGMGNALVR